MEDEVNGDDFNAFRYGHYSVHDTEAKLPVFDIFDM
jgi:hypothetical protein